MTTVAAACLGAPDVAFAAEPTITILPFNKPSDVVTNGKRVFVSGGAKATQVVVANAAGDITGTLDQLSGPTDLQLSNDGKILYVALPGAAEIVAFDTSSLRESARYSTGTATCPSSLAYTGRFLWFGYGCDLERGNVGRIDLTRTPAVVKSDLIDHDFYGAPLLASASGNTKVLLVGQPAMSPGTTWSYKIGTNGRLTLGSDTTSIDSSSNLRDLALNPAGTTAYTASGAPYRVRSFSMADLTRRGRTYKTGAYPNAVEISSDGTRIAGGADATNAPDVFVFDLVGEVLRQFELGGQEHKLVSKGLAWAPNGRKLYALSDDGYLYENPAQLHVLPVPAA